ncbi:hypothetical protein Nepgr_017573 [Nepenthes gracilis]|uniref:Uncharacterized protein n=1 Tax=Nepenthes gracilis TaxID=150966 RepID=A0AAD3XSA0_NEPGR|nr:hypothetical protein Nepgr_017573 [Nepenthes gracilis]
MEETIETARKQQWVKRPESKEQPRKGFRRRLPPLMLPLMVDQTSTEVNRATNPTEVPREENNDTGIVEEGVVAAGDVGDDAIQTCLEDDTVTVNLRHDGG